MRFIVAIPALVLLALATTANATTLTKIPPLPGDTRVTPTGCSSDGSVVVGYSELFGATSHKLPIRWTASGGTTLLAGGYQGMATACSNDGSVIVGTVTEGTVSVAVMWDSAGIHNLPAVQNSANSSAVAVSGDGSKIIGNSDTWAFLYSNGANTLLKSIDGQGSTFVNAISNDGSTIVGHQTRTGTSGGHTETWFDACKWNTAGTITVLSQGSWTYTSSSSSSLDLKDAMSATANGSKILTFEQERQNSKQFPRKQFLTLNGTLIISANPVVVDGLTNNFIFGPTQVNGDGTRVIFNQGSFARIQSYDGYTIAIDDLIRTRLGSGSLAQKGFSQDGLNVIGICGNSGWVAHLGPDPNNNFYDAVPNSPFNASTIKSVLWNDYIFGDAVLNSEPTHGVLTFNTDGSFTYTPDKDFVGNDDFTYFVTYHGVSTPPATVHMHVGVVTIARPLTNVFGGTSATGTAMLNFNATTNVTVTLKSSRPTVASVPATIVVNSGANRAQFPITTYPIATTQSPTISATLSGESSTCSITVFAASVKSIKTNLTSYVGNQNGTGTVTLEGPSPSGGTVVSLSSSDPAITVPSSFTIPAGSSSGTFAFHANPVITSTSVKLSASARGETQTVQTGVSAPTLKQLVFSPNSISSGGTTVLYVYTAGTVAVGDKPFAVDLTSSNVGVLPVPAAVEIQPGSNYVKITLTAGVVATPSGITVTGRVGSFYRSGTLIVNPKP